LKNVSPFLQLLQGAILTRAGQAKAGLADIEPALAAMVHSRGEDSVWTANAHLLHAQALAALGRNKQAEAESAPAWAVLQRMLDPNHIELRRHRVILSTWW
ncbi:MAG: hypothetical protein L0H70_02710, partial [Xanthomonadales bacterium]|nr:hypothetical protein [Xanthomonadales bacterium]